MLDHRTSGRPEFENLIRDNDFACDTNSDIEADRSIIYLLASSSLANRASSSVGISRECVTRCSQRVSDGGLGSILPA